MNRLPDRQTIHMKCQVISMANKIKKLKISSAANLLGALRVNICVT